jgi:ribose transport system permease protein
MSTTTTNLGPADHELPVALQRLGLRQRADLSPLVPLGVLLALVAIVSTIEPAFLGVGSLQDAGVTAGPILLLAFGNTLVILLGGIDLSVGALTTLCSVLLAKWLGPAGPLLGVVAVLAAATLLGALQGLIHAKTQIPSFIVTLGGLGIFAGLALKVSDASTLPIAENTQVLDWIAKYTGDVPNAVVVVVVALGVLSAVMRWTPLGRAIYAVGAAEPAARMSGVRVDRVRIAAFALSGLCAGIAALLLTAQTTFGSPSLATNLLLPAIAAVVVGGTAVSGGAGGLGRTLVGGLIVTTVTTGTVVLGLDPSLQNVAFGIGVVIAVSLTTDRKKIGIIK